jgi:hypothetical protein
MKMSGSFCMRISASTRPRTTADWSLPLVASRCARKLEKAID